MKVLALGDSHFMVSNLREMRVFLDKLKVYLDEHASEFDIIISLGDNLDSHERLHVEPLNMCVEYIKLLAMYRPTYVIVGNHDSTNNSIYLSEDHWLNCLKSWEGVTVVDSVCKVSIGGDDIVMCPYVPDGRFVEALSTLGDGWRNVSAIFSHVTIKGANMGSVIAEDADEWDSEFPMLISGHIHLRQWLADNMYYTGSIIQVAVDEPPEKSIAYVTIDGGSVKVDEIDLELPKKVIIRIDIEDVNDFVLPEEPNTKYTLYLSGSYEAFKSFRKSSKYKSLIKEERLGKRIRYKMSRKERNAENERLTGLGGDQMKFSDILRNSIADEGDALLTSFYQHLLVGDKEDLSGMLDRVLIL